MRSRLRAQLPELKKGYLQARGAAREKIGKAGAGIFTSAVEAIPSVAGAFGIGVDRPEIPADMGAFLKEEERNIMQSPDFMMLSESGLQELGRKYGRSLSEMMGLQAEARALSLGGRYE